MDDITQTLDDVKFEQFNRQLMEAEEDIKYAREEYDWKMEEQNAKWDEFYEKQFEVDAMDDGDPKDQAQLLADGLKTAAEDFDSEL